MKIIKIAFLILLIGAPGVHAFVLNVNSSGFERRWDLLVPNPSISTNIVNPDTHAIRYFLASDAYSTTNAAAELDAVRAAFAEWQSIPDTHLKFEEAGLFDPPVDVAVDDKNIVYWAKTSTLVNGGMDDISGFTGLTFSRFGATDNELREADIVFNGVEDDWYTDYFKPENASTFVEGVALHEIGHFIGLLHSPIGGATMLFAGLPGVNTQTGLSEDEISAARHLYPVTPDNYGTVTGVVTEAGSPVFGAAVYLQNAIGDVVAGTVTAADGTYLADALIPGSYDLWVAPLDESAASPYLCKGSSISSSFSGADTAFLPTTNFPVTVTAGTTNAVNITVNADNPAFRISRLRRPTTSVGSYSVSSSPFTMTVGQSNYYIGVLSTNLPTNNATLTITGDGLTVGSVIYVQHLFANANVPEGYNAMSVPISISSNATPGLRNMIVQDGSNMAIANGFMDILPAAPDYNFDGLDDTFQRTYFSPFTSPQAAPGMDADGDTMENSAEYVAGTDPTNAASLLRMLSVSNNVAGLVVSWQSVNGKRYQLSTRTNATEGIWKEVGSPITATGPTAEYVDSAATNEIRLYRVSIAP